MIYPIIVYEYHRFGDEREEYKFSRTYKQFEEDLKTTFDWLVFDDGYQSQIKACEMARQLNIRVKLAIITSWIGKPNYLTKEEIKELSKYHDIENHTHHHKVLTELPDDLIEKEIKWGNKVITEIIGRIPRYLICPHNQVNNNVREIANKLGLVVLEDRTTIYNDTNITNI